MTILSEGVEGLMFSTSDFSLFCLLLSALFWVSIHQKISPWLPYYFLPTSAWQQHHHKITLYQQNKKTEKNREPLDIGAEMFPLGEGLTKQTTTPTDLKIYYVTSRANSTAFLHSLIICPMALAVVFSTICKAREEISTLHWIEDGDDNNLFKTLKSYLWDWGETDAFFNHRSFLLDIIAYVMAGYFLWDLVECFKHRDVHSKAFVLHGLLSLYAMVAYLLTPKGKMTGVSAFMCLSEISTPVIHLRWFLIQSQETQGFLFKLCNVGAAVLFIFYRLGVVPLLALPHLALDLFRGCIYTSIAPLFRRISFSISCCLWVSLNAYWAMLFIKSHLKHRQQPKECKQS